MENSKVTMTSYSDLFSWKILNELNIDIQSKGRRLQAEKISKIQKPNGTETVEYNP